MAKALDASCIRRINNFSSLRNIEKERVCPARFEEVVSCS